MKKWCTNKKWIPILYSIGDYVLLNTCNLPLPYPIAIVIFDVPASPVGGVGTSASGLVLLLYAAQGGSAILLDPSSIEGYCRVV